jgi:hypothetical protein
MIFFFLSNAGCINLASVSQGVRSVRRLFFLGQRVKVQGSELGLGLKLELGLGLGLGLGLALRVRVRVKG